MCKEKRRSLKRLFYYSSGEIPQSFFALRSICDVKFCEIPPLESFMRKDSPPDTAFKEEKYERIRNSDGSGP